MQGQTVLADFHISGLDLVIKDSGLRYQVAIALYAVPQVPAYAGDTTASDYVVADAGPWQYSPPTILFGSDNEFFIKLRTGTASGERISAEGQIRYPDPVEGEWHDASYVFVR